MLNKKIEVNEMRRYTIKLLILLLLIVISCKTVEINQKPSDTKAKPCWAKKNLQECQMISGEYHHFVVELDRNITNSKDIEKKLIREELALKYRKFLKSNLIQKFLSNELCKSSDKINKRCKQEFEDGIESILDQFNLYDRTKLIEIYIENRSKNKIKIHGLGGISKSRHINLVKTIMINNLQSKLDKIRVDVNAEIIIQENNVSQISERKESSNKNFEKTQNSHVDTKNFEPELPESQNCFQSTEECNVYYKLTKFSDNLKHIESTDEAESIQTKRLDLIIEKLNQIRELKYNKSSKHPIILDPMDRLKELFPNTTEIPNMNKNYNLIAKEQKIKFDTLCRCLEKKANKKNIEYFYKKMELLEDLHRQNSELNTYKNYEFEWRTLMESIRQKKTEIKQLEKMFRQRLNLLTHTYILFTYVNNPNDRFYSDQFFQQKDNLDILAKLEIIENAIHYINYRFEKKKDNFVIQVIASKYQYGIKPSASDGIELHALSGAKGYIQKYELIEENHEKPKNLKPLDRDLSNQYSGAKIISGCLNLDIYESGNGIYKCKSFGKIRDSIYQHISVLAKKHSIGIDSLKQKEENILKFIEDVIRKNASMQKEYFELKKDYEIRRLEKDNAISSFKKKLIDNNNKLKSTFKQLQENMLLPVQIINSKAESDEIIKQKGGKLKIYFEQVKHKTNTESKKLNKQEPRILVTIIDENERWNPENVRKRTREKFDALVKNSCTSFNTGNNITYGENVSQMESLQFITQPEVVSFDIPIFRSRKILNRSSIEFSFPIVLKVICRGIPERFSYDGRTQEIIDNIKKIRWEAGDFPFTPRRRKDNDNFQSEFESLNINDINQAMSFFDDYNSFCKDYNKFLDRMYEDTTTNYPKMRCLKHFEYYPNSEKKIIIDNLRREKWTIFPKRNYSDFNREMKISENRTISSESLIQFFKELCDAIKKDNSLSIVIDDLKDKYFWTNTRYGRRQLILMYDFENKKIKNDREVKKENMAFGIAKSKLIY